MATAFVQSLQSFDFLWRGRTVEWLGKMETFPQRLRQVWLTCFALVLGLPWLVCTGTGLCPLVKGGAAVKVIAHTTADCCERCCAAAPVAASTRSAPAPDPTQAMICCEVFRAYLPLASRGSQIRWLAAPEDTLEKSLTGDHFSAFALAIIRMPDGRLAIGCPSGFSTNAFLRTVARRSHPAHAPPTAALLS